MVTVTDADLFEVRAQVLVNPVNAIGVSGKGLALEFKKRFPIAQRTYEDMARIGALEAGGCILAEEGDLTIAFLATKGHWRQPSQDYYVMAGALQLCRYAKGYSYASIAVPALGCGLGGLDRTFIRPELTRLFNNEIPATTVYLCNPR